MGKASERCAARMEEILSAYHRATVDLLDALRSKDEEEALRAEKMRASCIEAYSDQMDLWLGLPENERFSSFRDVLGWHHSRINEAETDVGRFIRSLRDELGDLIVRIGSARKAERAYRAPGSGKPCIVRGES